MASNNDLTLHRFWSYFNFEESTAFTHDLFFIQGNFRIDYFRPKHDQDSDERR